MVKSMYISLPCKFENGTLTVKGLGLNGKGEPKEEAFFNAIKAVPELYSELCTSVVTDTSILVPHSKKVYERILELEPLPEDRATKAKKDGLFKPTSEDVLKYGYEGK